MSNIIGVIMTNTIDAQAERGITMNRTITQLKVKDFVSHLVTDMFNITATYWINHEMYEEDLTVQTLERDFSEYGVSYITIQNGRMVIGLNTPT